MSGDGPEEHARAGAEHLQAAARELIKASRSLLDAAEELVEDPRAVQDVVRTLAGLAQAATSRVRGQSGQAVGTDREDAEGAGGGGHVTPIRLS